MAVLAHELSCNKRSTLSQNKTPQQTATAIWFCEVPTLSARPPLLSVAFGEREQSASR